MTQPGYGYGYNNYPYPLYGPSLPFYWQQPFYAPSQPQVPPRYVCKKDEEDEEKFVCEVDPETVQQPQQLVRQPVMYVRPFAGNWFF